MKAHRGTLAALLAGALLILAIGCDDSETIAPDGSTITLNANPSQIILVGATQVNPITVVAAVRNSIGVPLPGQDVRFTNNNGQLNPPGNTPVTTDSIGNATCVLTAAVASTTITATSGKATASITVNASTGIVSQILIEADTTVLNDCSDPINLTATALGPTGTPVSGFTLFFEMSPPGEATDFVASNLPISGVTDANGEVTRPLTLNQTRCDERCVGTGKDCTAFVRATDTGAQIVSLDLEITDAIP